MMLDLMTQKRLELLGCLPCLGLCGTWLQCYPESAGPAPVSEGARLYFRAIGNGVLCPRCGEDEEKHEEARARWRSAEHTIRTAQRPGEDWRAYIKRIMHEEPI